MIKRATGSRERVLDTETTSDRIKRMSECDARVLAMLIDCRGRIHGAQTTEETIEVPYRKPEVEVTMKSILPVVCASVWCGRFGVIGEDGRRLPIWATGDSYIWEIGTERETVQLLTRIKPYVREKREQVGIALEMLEILRKKENGFEKATQACSERLGKANSRLLPDIPESLKERLEKVKTLEKTKAGAIVLTWLVSQISEKTARPRCRK